MQEAFFSFISQFGYFAVAGLILFENVFPPIPSELILPLSGFLATQTAMTLPGVIIAATVGSVVGAYFLYGIGRLLSQERLEGFFDTKPMRMLGFHSDDVAKAIGWFDRKGQIMVSKEVTAQAEWVSSVVKVVIIVVAVAVVAWWIKFRILPARAEQKRREAEGE